MSLKWKKQRSPDDHGISTKRCSVGIWAIEMACNLVFFIHLPQLPAVHVQRREPATIAAASVQALQVAQIQDFGLRRVADDGDLAGAVRGRRDVIPQGQPAQRVHVQAVQRHIRLVVGVDDLGRVLSTTMQDLGFTTKGWCD